LITRRKKISQQSAFNAYIINQKDFNKYSSSSEKYPNLLLCAHKFSSMRFALVLEKHPIKTSYPKYTAF